MQPGIRTVVAVTANQTFTNNAVLASVGLTAPIAVNARKKIRAWIPISVGATGGVRAELLAPAGFTIYELTLKLQNTVTPSTTRQIVNTPTVFTSALADAGSHWLEIEAIVIAGATAGNLDLQLAQNTADANTLTVLRGATMEVVEF